MKRKPPNADHATMYFVDALTRMRPDEKTGTRWGEAMVHAEVEAMRLANMDAAQRSARLNSSAVGWFARGYRFYLMPTATDAPASLVSLRGHQSPSPQKMAQHQARTMAQEAGEMWRRGQSATSIFAEAEREKAKEMPLPVHTPSPPKAPKQNVGDRRNPRPLLTAIKSVSDAPELPTPLHQLLTKPRSSDCLTNTPSESMRDTLRDMLTENRVLRVWENRKLSTLQARACNLQTELQQRDLGIVWGLGKKTDDNKLKGLGLEQISCGTFNGIWRMGQNRTAALDMFPTEARQLFVDRKVVLRAPLTTSRWVTLEELLGEVNNMVFLACTGIGPRIAALSYARKVAQYSLKREEGAVIVLYRLYAFLEYATLNTDQRFDPTCVPNNSALGVRNYYHALLVAIYRISREGYVHLDATLRNFVDFYPTTLGRAVGAFSVRIIDVDEGCFRRLRSESGTEWRSLFLFNLLVVLVFLKMRLVNRWDADMYWRPVKAFVQATIEKLPPMKEANCICSHFKWVGDYHYGSDGTPDINRGQLVGATDRVAANAANAQLRYYLLTQPLDEAMVRYVNYVPANEEAAAKSRRWYDTIYRDQMLPTLRFFLGKLPEGTQPPRFVDVAAEYLDTPHATLQQRFLPNVRPSAQHHKNTTEEEVLGIPNQGGIHND